MRSRNRFIAGTIKLRRRRRRRRRRSCKLFAYALSAIEAIQFRMNLTNGPKNALWFGNFLKDTSWPMLLIILKKATETPGMTTSCTCQFSNIGNCKKQLSTEWSCLCDSYSPVVLFAISQVPSSKLLWESGSHGLRWYTVNIWGGRWLKPRKYSDSITEVITVAGRCKAWTVLARSNIGIVGSNPTQGMDGCVCVYSVFVLSCV
jgi:hypothetical protein